MYFSKRQQKPSSPNGNLSTPDDYTNASLTFDEDEDRSLSAEDIRDNSSPAEEETDVHAPDGLSAALSIWWTAIPIGLRD